MPPPKPLRLLMNYFCLLVLLSAAVLGSPTTPAANNLPASASTSVDDVNGPNCLGASLTILAPLPARRYLKKKLPKGVRKLSAKLRKPFAKLASMGSCLNFRRQPSRREQTQQFDEQPAPHLEQLPEDLLIQIASILPTSDLKNFEATCKTVRGFDLALARERAELNEYRYYNKGLDWLEDTWVDLLCKDRDVNRFDVRLVVQEYLYYVRKNEWRFFDFGLMMEEELRRVMKWANDDEGYIVPINLAEQVLDLYPNYVVDGRLVCRIPKPKREPLFFLDTDLPWYAQEREYYSDDRRMDGEIALILSQCEHATANKAYAYIQKENQDPAYPYRTLYDIFDYESQHPAYREDNGPELANLVAYLKDVHKARREIWKEKLAASDSMGFDDDSRMAVVLEKLLPDVGRRTIKDAIQQARRTLGLEIAVQNRKYCAVRYYVKLGGAIQESSLKRIFRSVTMENRQVLPILLQLKAVSVDMFSWLLLDVLERKQEPSVVKLVLEDPRAVRPAIDKAYKHAFTTSEVHNAYKNYQRVLEPRRTKEARASVRADVRKYRQEVEERVEEVRLAFQENDKRRAE